MFQTLTQNFTKIFDKIKSTGNLTEEQIDASMRDIRIALLDADVALPKIKLKGMKLSNQYLQLK
jgi:signal recognition particle subunit SRP54